ncbi:glycosyltransferase family 2 protein [Halobacteria archaeon AArc-m2/3/4]|uniref:Glycosyltransferase family 2 protein n=1 Tax=Natronoglomus mannanivorans TaxID=2979990 RepID=A0ABT2QGU4_9EURY|nr:glycosyltransferase family 2 protein [Halobacteria archaeon AArc-m2/3/4]
MSLVTVVVPTYNRADVLPRAIDSALAQTVDDLEILVVDDGSTDDTQTVLASYETPRVQSIVHETNRGANVARNTGIEHANGEFVAFLDSDDEWRPTKLERQFAALEDRGDGSDESHEEWVAAYCDFAVETSGRTAWLEKGAARVLSRADPERPMEGGPELTGAILADEIHPGAGSTLLVRTEVVREIGGFDETLDRFQDPEIVLRILREGKLAYVDEPLIVRHETGSPDTEIVAEASEQYLETYADEVERFEAKGYDIRASHALVLAKGYFSEGRFLRGTRQFQRAAVARRHYPGLLWAAGVGARRRAVPMLAVLTLVSAVAWMRRS